jgi:hypothetical protein
MPSAGIILPSGIVTVSPTILKKVDEFIKNLRPYEIASGGQLNLFLDERSGAYYLTCHLEAQTLVESSDTSATLDKSDDEDEIYKLNRDVSEDEGAFKIMEADALKGRSFEDLVLEYDTGYRAKKPLKVYGGQHRIRAVTKAIGAKPTTLHGVRVYFGLSREQKVEIATVNNTAIAVAYDLLDRMKEQLLGDELVNWCQAVGMLPANTNFADRRSPLTPTVRLARTLLVNFHLGKMSADSSFKQPILCKSGGMDDDYAKLRSIIDWKDAQLQQMGKQFARLNDVQRTTVTNREDDDNAEFARKALSLSVVASYGYAAGLLQKSPDRLKNLYSLPDNVTPPDDPLNAKVLSQARLKGTDPDTYRGLGTRSSPRELGRMLEVFLVLADKGKSKITKPLANAAIQSFEAKRATHESEKALARI